MYARVHNITNVGGRINYVKNKENREEVVGFCSTASEDFWRLLAQENQEQFLRSTNAKRKNSKASEAREIVVGLPKYAADQDAAAMLAEQVKQKLGVDCIVAIHKKSKPNDAGEKVLNVHAHIILAERTLLDEPMQVEEKRAPRTYYYDAAGKKCKKENAVKVVPKGTITQEACIRFFSDKLNFFNLKTFEPLLNDFARQFNFQKFDATKHFPQKKIGQNNPKEDFVREYNDLVKEMNSFFDDQDAGSSGRPAKEEFCEKYSVPQRFSVYQTATVREKFEEYRRSFEVPVGVLQSELQQLRTLEAEVAKDIEQATYVLSPIVPGDFAGAQVSKIYQRNLEEKYSCRVDKGLLGYLQELLAEIRASITAIFAALGITAAGRNNDRSQNDRDYTH